MKDKDKERALRLVWSSLQSHLPWTYKPSSEGRRFHKQCVRDYSELMRIIANL